MLLPRSVVCSWGCQDQHSWCVLCQRKWVSWRVQGHFFGGFVCNMYWWLNGLPNGFWGLDVALGLRVNQYKRFMYLFLPLNSFKFSCYCFVGINNWLFRRNNRLFFWCFAVLCFISWLTEFLIEFHRKDFVLAKKVFKNLLKTIHLPSRLRPYILKEEVFFCNIDLSAWSVIGTMNRSQLHIL